MKKKLILKGRLSLVKKTKVLFFIYEMGAGGAARTMLNILNHIDKSKFEPILVTLNYDGSYEKYLDSDVTFIKLDAKRLRSAIFPLAKVIRQKKVDIVFSTIPTYNTVAILARLLSFTKAKSIVREAAFLGGNTLENIKLIVYGLLYRMSSKVIALSRGVKANLVDRYKIKPKHIEVIYNPVDINSIQQRAKRGKIAEEHQFIFSSNKKVIITAGRLVAEKDQHTLLTAFAKVTKGIDSHLVILGEGELESTLKERAKQLGIEKDVHFIGFLQNPYVYFKRADLFALSSKNEGFGHVLVEALATGTPIVSTNCKPGAEEVLEHGEFGKICEVGNADEMAKKIKNVLTLDETERNLMIEKGLRRANDFDAPIIVKQYENIFTQVLNIKEQR